MMVLLCFVSLLQLFQAAGDPLGDLALGHFSSPQRTVEGQIKVVSFWPWEGIRVIFALPLKVS